MYTVCTKLKLKLFIKCHQSSGTSLNQPVLYYEPDMAAKYAIGYLHAFVHMYSLGQGTSEAINMPRTFNTGGSEYTVTTTSTLSNVVDRLTPATDSPTSINTTSTKVSASECTVTPVCSC